MFAASIFLTGLIAVGIPVAIHLLTRQKSQVMGWGATDFLKESINSASSRRQRLKDRLLLLLRSLAILFLILTFAQPLASKLFRGNSQLETILIWDISLSTSVRDRDGVPHQEMIRQALLERLDELPNQSSVRILLAGADIRWLGELPVTLSSANRKNLVQAINEQKVDLGGGHIAKAILLALSTSGEEKASQRKDLVVFHDLQESSLLPEEKDRWQVVAKRLAESSMFSLELASLQDFQMKQGRQAAVVRLETDQDTVATGSRRRFSATLRNYSEDPILAGEVSWLVNGKEIERLKNIDLQAKSELNLEQFLIIEEPGSQTIECRFEVEDDPLPADNRAFLTLSATTQLPVLIVDDTLRIEEGQILPSQFIAAALGGRAPQNPKESNRPKGRHHSIFNPKVIQSKDLNQEQLEGNLAIIIANASSLPAGMSEQLKEFVAKGRGLWIMMDSTEKTLPKWTSHLITTLDLDTLSETTLVENDQEKDPMRITTTVNNPNYSDSIAAPNLDLFRAEITKLHQLADLVFLHEETLLQTPEGEPVILSIPAAPGRVILQMCDLRRSTTNLPILQTFVPLMRVTLRECIGDGISPRNLEPGQTFGIPSMNLDAARNWVTVTRPDGSSEELKPLEGRFQTAKTLLPGIYKIEGFRGIDGKPITEAFAVKRPQGESDLSFLSGDQVNDLFTRKSPESDTKLPADHRENWSLAIWFAMIAGLLFLAEALLSHHLAKRRINTAGRIELKPVY